MATAKYDITTRKNDSVQRIFTFYEEDGTTPWVISGYCHTMQVRDNNGCLVLDYTGDSITCTCNTATIYKGYDETGQDACAYTYQYQLQLDATCFRCTPFGGNYNVEKDVNY